MAAERKRAPKKRKRKRTPKVAAAELAIERRREQTTKLRLAGWSIRDIAGHLKCSVGTIHSDLSEVLLRTQDTTDDAVKKDRALSVARLDKATKGIWPQVESGEVDAVDRLVKLEARRAKLLGLDAPTRQELSGPGGGAIPVEAQTSLARKLDDLRKRLVPPESSGEAGS
jgi:hypothetical protein